jgi:hypothetical protein
MFELEINTEPDPLSHTVKMRIYLADHKNGCRYDEVEHNIDMDRQDYQHIANDYIRMYKQTLVECGAV